MVSLASFTAQSVSARKTAVCKCAGIENKIIIDNSRTIGTVSILQHQAQSVVGVVCQDTVVAHNSWQGWVQSVVATIPTRVEGPPVPEMITSGFCHEQH